MSIAGAGRLKSSMVASSQRSQQIIEHSATLAHSQPYESVPGASSPQSLRGSHRHTPSVAKKGSRRSLAAFARDKTSNAIANLTTTGHPSDHSLRPATSSTSLYRKSRAFALATDLSPPLLDQLMPNPNSKPLYEPRSAPIITGRPSSHSAKS